jgi:trans-aconitate 2-methyltransferase
MAGTVSWDPTQYTRYADDRGRPFVDLLARVGATAPRRVVDLGCGPGNMTTLLGDRWPSAQVEGIDSSAEMIAAAAPLATSSLSFSQGDATTWTMPSDTDVLLTNATLQWVPGHRALLTRWAAALPAGGWLAFQVPGNFDSPSHVAMREAAASPRWASRVGDALLRPDSVGSAPEYATLLQDAGLVADTWETTYVHVLAGPDPVLDWVRGTGLRPALAVLSESDGAEFSSEVAVRLRAAYPATPHGTLFPFRRIFAVAHKPA